MKKTLLTISVLMFSHAALAMHAYGEDTCTAQLGSEVSLKIELSNGEPADNHMIVDLNNSDIRYDVVFNGAPMGVDDGGNGDLVLKSKGDTHVVTKNTSDGCFEGSESTSAREAVVVSVSKKLAQAYGIKKGQVLNFSCYYDHQEPSGSHCN